LLTLRGHTAAVTCVGYSPDGTRLATGSADTTAALWDVALGRRLLTLKGHAEGLKGLAFAPGGDRLATWSPDGIVRVWDTATGQGTVLVRGGVLAVAFSSANPRLAAAGEGGLWVWDGWASKPRPCSLAGAVRLAAFSPDSRRLASADLGGAVRVWEVVSGELALALPGGPATLTDLAWGADGRRLAVASGDRTIRVWEVAAGKELARLRGPAASLVFGPDGRRLLAAANDLEAVDQPGRAVWLRRTWQVWAWDTATGEGKVVLHGTDQAERVVSLAWRPCGTRLATAHENGEVKVWSVKDLLGQ
jgi:WD40 repeat protein